jgi:hypothetical protein
LRSVTWGGSRLTGSATRPTRSVPAGWAAAGPRAPATARSPTDVNTPRSHVRLLLIMRALPRQPCQVAKRGATLHQSRAGTQRGTGAICFAILRCERLVWLATCPSAETKLTYYRCRRWDGGFCRAPARWIRRPAREA